MTTGRPTASSRVRPNVCSALGFQAITHKIELL
jgi:hypothetical protein